MSARLRVAVVGGGAAGITAAHDLADDHDVTLFEASPALGGHAHAALVDDGHGGTIAVDTAFLIYNELHYPRFVELIRELGVEAQTHPAEMSAAFIDDERRFHYALGRGLDALFYQRRNAVNPRFYRLFVELFSFRRRAYLDITAGRIPESVTLGEYLRPYSKLFQDNFVVPLASAIWSLPDTVVLAYPARQILQFFMNHRLLRGKSGDAWRTFRGSSRSYVGAFERQYRGRLALDSAVHRVRRVDGRAQLFTSRGPETFDRVVLATHADVSLRMLDDPSAAERSLLGAWAYHPNTVVLHRDASVLHADRRLWASWNVVRRAGRQRVTYYLNRVQELRSRLDYFLTLGDGEIDRSLEVARFSYRHPVFDAASVATQARLGSLNGERGTFFCGSYHGHGFHEDAVASARRAGAALRAQALASEGRPANVPSITIFPVNAPP